MENVIALNNQEMTMSSLEIAELTGKAHKHVMRDTRNMLDALGLCRHRFGLAYYDKQNKPRNCYKLPKDLCLTLVSGYNVILRKRIIDRWLELESQEKPELPDFNNPAAAARAWANEVEQNQKAQQQLLEAKPAIDFVDRYVDANGLQTLTNVAKMLQLGRNRFVTTLLDEKVLYRCNGDLVPRQNYTDQKYFVVKTGERNGHAFVQTFVTAKGIQWLAKRYGEECAA